MTPMKGTKVYTAWIRVTGLGVVLTGEQLVNHVTEVDPVHNGNMEPSCGIDTRKMNSGAQMEC